MKKNDNETETAGDLDLIYGTLVVQHARTALDALDYGDVVEAYDLLAKINWYVERMENADAKQHGQKIASELVEFIEDAFEHGEA